MNLTPTPEESVIYDSINTFLLPIYSFLDFVYYIYDEYIDNIFDIIFDYLNYISILLFILYFISSFIKTGIEKYHYEIVQVLLKILISTTLMIKFNPIYPKEKFSDFDKKVVFSSGVFLCLTLLNDFVTYITEKFNVKKKKI